MTIKGSQSHLSLVTRITSTYKTQTQWETCCVIKNTSVFRLQILPKAARETSFWISLPLFMDSDFSRPPHNKMCLPIYTALYHIVVECIGTSYHVSSDSLLVPFCVRGSMSLETWDAVESQPDGQRLARIEDDAVGKCAALPRAGLKDSWGCRSQETDKKTEGMKNACIWGGHRERHNLCRSETTKRVQWCSRHSGMIILFYTWCCT